MKLFLGLILTVGSFAQSSELGLSLGTLPPQGRLGNGMTLGINYAQRLWAGERISLLAEGSIVASPLRKSTTKSPGAERDVASLYVMPGLRVKLMPKSRVSPFVAGGMGYAQYHESALLQNGAVNPERARQHGFGGNVGGGLDVQVWKRLALRGEVRNYITDTPRSNVVVSGGLVLRFGR